VIEYKESEKGGACSTHGKMRSEYKILLGKPEGKRPLERPRRRWEDNVKLDFRRKGWEDVDWM
jgi:hypothetical protein